MRSAPRELIITNGDSAGALLRQAMPGVEVLPWRDVLHEGPAPVTHSLAELTDIRANYLARDGGDLDQTRTILQARDRGLARSTSFDRIVLWFEHDLYGQLQLLQVLDWFSLQREEEDSRGRAGERLSQQPNARKHFGLSGTRA